MKAAVYRKSEGLVIEDVPMPESGQDGIVVKVSNTGFCGSDHSLIAGSIAPDGCILGHETSGTIVEVGSDVVGPKPGTKVIIRPTYCGECRDCKMGKPYFCQNNRRTIGIGDLPGAFAEYIKVFPQMIIPVPEGVDSQNAALAEAFAAAYHGIECSRKKGGSALVIGGGPIGLALAMLLKVAGFGPVVLSEPIPIKRELALKIGVDNVIDPISDDISTRVFEYTEGIGFETVFECSGAVGMVQGALQALARGGTVCVVSVIFNEIRINALDLTFKEAWVTASYANTHEENIQILKWMSEGKLDGRPLVTDLINLEQLPEAYKERIDTGKAIKVMLQIGEEF